jgi:anti-anti-sigma factor
MRQGDHRCLGFHSDEHRREVIGAFVAAGLRAGHRVLYFANTTTRDDLGGWLDERGLSIDEPLASGQLVFAGGGGAYVEHGAFDPDATVARLRLQVIRARAERCPVLRVTGEMDWALTDVRASHRLLEYETKVDRLFRSGLLMGICQYDVRRFSADELAGIAQVHGGSVDPDPIYIDALLRITRTFDRPGLRLSGEIDASNAASVAGVVAAGPADGSDVHLDVSGVSFCDVDGIRVFVSRAEALGRRVVLRGLSPDLERVMRLVGWIDVEGTAGPNLPRG